MAGQRGDAGRPLLPETNLRGDDDYDELPEYREDTPSPWRRFRRLFSRMERWHNLNWMIVTYPEVAANYVLRGELLLRQGDTLGAIADFRRGLDLALEQMEQEDWGMVAQAVQDRALAGLRDALYRAPRYNPDTD